MRSVLTGVVLPALLVLGSVGGAAAYTAVTVDGADRTVPATLWAKPAKEPAKDPAAEAWRGRASTPLSKLLLPVPDGYRLGPDVDEYGNDAELSAKQATALMKGWGRGLSGKERRDYERQVKKLGLQGIAIRSYATEGGVYENDVIVTIQIVRMRNKAQVRKAFGLQTGLGGLLDLPKGPKIKGHRNSACFLAPEVKGDRAGEDEKEIDRMQCFAYDSELLVSIGAEGVPLIDEGAVADLVQEQLDHIASPGEYV
ncbi:hypothetical protein [Streptomyces sp. NBC_01794]|uniref:hypothetical protein n=1 Tax=Streptomyces sp. NBC_01794 TaxID=2975942 RepID=UPI00308B9B76|nr:hypothetical protein OIE54_40970 [Streptomyces sp. NBC_01794]